MSSNKEAILTQNKGMCNVFTRKRFLATRSGTQKAAFAYSSQNIHLAACFCSHSENKLHKENMSLLATNVQLHTALYVPAISKCAQHIMRHDVIETRKPAQPGVTHSSRTYRAQE